MCSSDLDGIFPNSLTDLVRTAPRTAAVELEGLLSSDAVTLIDIRNPGERDFGVIDGARSIPLAQLRSQIEDLPRSKPIVVHCAGGWRSSVAASLLRADGIENVSDLVGGYTAWVERSSE